MDMGTIEFCCALLECFEHNRRLLLAYCGLSVHTAGILCHSVVGEMYFLIYVHWCLQHPLIYKQVRYCNIYSIIWLADFQFRFYVSEVRGGGGHSLLFFMRVDDLFHSFLQWGSLTLPESF